MNTLQISFSTPETLLPAIIQDADTLKVLMLGYVNQEAFKQTLKTKKVTFYSRSKKRTWIKGETSGHFLKYISHRVDCDKDCILIFAQPQGPVCHTLASTCFESNKQKEHFSLPFLENIITERMQKKSKNSYITHLTKKGIEKISQKLGEEATELIIEAMKKDKKKFLNEAGDLLFHFLILLQAKEYKLKDVIKILSQRHNKKTQTFK